MSNVPPGTKKKHLRAFLAQVGEVHSIQRLGNKQSHYPEFIVDIGNQRRTEADRIARMLDNRVWRNKRLHAHVPVFQ
ncbi:MAG: RNA recognition motif domain-containing protein [bacterium]